MNLQNMDRSLTTIAGAVSNGKMVVDIGDATVKVELQTGPQANASNYGGTTATTDANATTVIAANANADYHHVQINNTGSAAGQFSIDGGTTWHYLAASGSAGSALVWDGVLIHNVAVQIKRIGATNMSGVYVQVW